MHLVAELVSEHGLDLVGGELAEQGVEEKDATGAAQSYHGGIRGPALARLVGDPDAEHRNAGSRRHPQHARPEIAVLERGEPIEERDQQRGSGEGEQGIAQEKEQGAPEPPPGGRAQKRVHDERGHDAEQRGDRARLGHVREPEAKRLMEEPEAPRQQESGYPRQRQGDEAMTEAQDEQGERHLQPPVRCEGDEGIPQGDAPPGGEPGDEVRDGHREAERGEAELAAMVGSRALRVVHAYRLHASSPYPESHSARARAKPAPGLC